jgi:hypothetical protein
MLELRLHRKEAQLQDLEQEQWHQLVLMHLF